MYGNNDEKSFKFKMSQWTGKINTALESYVPVKNVPEKSIYEGMRYSLFAGGKRIRPIICLAVCEVLDGNMDDVLPFACAVEMIHTYSLIHDDLPAMDDDDYRRGKLTNHKVFGEAAAILAGDALLNTAYEIMLEHTLKNRNNLVRNIEAMDIIAKAAGTSGMIGGQVVDLESAGEKITKEILEYMHRCKTGALLKAPAMAAAIICGAPDKEKAMIEEFAENIGLAFQIRDDILDIEGDLESMGKQSGSDAKKQKSTFVSLYGLEESKKLLKDITDAAISKLDYFGEKAVFLKTLAYKLAFRNN